MGPAQAQTQPITGVYRLTTKAQPDLCLEVSGSTNASGTSVALNTASQTANQQWLVEAQSDGSYKIYAFSGQNSLQMLDSNGGANGAAVHTWEDLAVDGSSDANQRWDFVSEGSGYYRITPVAAGGASSTMTLDVGSGDAVGAVGETTDIAPYTGGGNQLFKLDWAGPTQILPNPKKGLPANDFNIAGLNCSWTYNWGYGTPSDIPTGVEYVPMVWSWSGDTNIGSKVLAADPGMKHVLGYNEPDEPNSVGGSNMSVATALQGFQYVSALSLQGIGIGSPACAVDSDSWMQSFMSQALTAPYNYHIDFVTLHSYTGGSDPTTVANSFLGFVDYIHTLYGYPLWITEFAPTDLSTAGSATYLRLVCQGLNSRSYVQRYSFFTSEAAASSGLGASALINTDGTYTSVGKLYARL